MKSTWLGEGLGVDSIENLITRSYLIKSCLGDIPPEGNQLECLHTGLGSPVVRLNHLQARVVA